MLWLEAVGLGKLVGITYKRHILCDCLGVHILFLWLILFGSRDKNYGSCQLLIKFWPFLANCYRSYYLASWIGTRDSNLASCSSDLCKDGFLGCLLLMRA